MNLEINIETADGKSGRTPREIRERTKTTLSRIISQTDICTAKMAKKQLRSLNEEESAIRLLHTFLPISLCDDCPSCKNNPSE